jgi:hypothetical protein
LRHQIGAPDCSQIRAARQQRARPDFSDNDWRLAAPTNEFPDAG